MQTECQGGFLISKIKHLSGRIFARMLKEHGIEINPAQGRIMFVLWQYDAIPIRTLALETGLGKSTLTSMLDHLEVSGFIVRERSDMDRRVILVKRTDKDRAWQSRYEQVSREMTEIYYAGLSSAEIEGFEQTLNKILSNLAGQEPRLP
ncbi:MarR family transcriptional regulator [Candidatus Bipolaricaulota bacterium]|nr:MarR family transcriptional regulator [Candidatus Bipolaricaulota bacterium]